MDLVGFDDWKRWVQQGCTRLPAVEVRRDVALPDSWECFAEAPVSVILESAQAGRYTYICDRPRRVIIGDADSAEIRPGDFAGAMSPPAYGDAAATTFRNQATGSSALPLSRRVGKPLEILRSVLAEAKTPALSGWPAMTGGLLGAFGYDLVHTWERLPVFAKRDLPLPLYAMIETRELFIYDHAERTLGVVAWCDIAASGRSLSEEFRLAQSAADCAIERWFARTVRSELVHASDADCASELAASASCERPAEKACRERPPSAPPPSFTPEAFRSAVERVHEYIAAGHTYQVNLSLRTSRVTPQPAEWIYEALRRINPSPYMGLLRLPDFALVCGSPELLVRLMDGVVSSRPIAGTRPRGDAPPQDSDYSAELLANEKERAEHLMLVDLIRNDIGRVSEFGSVQVKEFMALERYSHVMHIVSQVEGRLAAGQTWADVLQAMFPGGTITGCPKFRTMEIIEELEPVARGFYTGALGWISFGGQMEMNIIIRSMLVQNGVAHVQAGAGIVADSQPERELDEALRKAQALWVALDEAAAKYHA